MRRLSFSFLLPLLLLALPLALPCRADGIGTPIVYRTVEDRELRIWVQTPAKDAATPRPCVVFFHGGGWVGGAPGQFNSLAKHFNDRGVVTAQVEYRLLDRKGNAPPTKCCQDAVAAMQWVYANAERFNIDADRVAASGGSAGGHLAAYVGLVDSPYADGQRFKPNSLILFNPVCDNGPGEWGDGRVGDRYDEFSPAHNISADDPPTLYLIGDSDRLIPVETATRFRKKMQAAGVRCDLHVYAGQAHGFFNDRNGKNPYYGITKRAADAFLVSLGWVPERA